MEKQIILDTTSKYLVVALADETKIIDKIQYVAWQRQSEYAVTEIDNILKNKHMSSDQITRIVVTNGPGSYTGVRIALTIAKVWSLAKNIPVCVLSSLQAIAGCDGKKIAILDARSKRAYVGIYENGIALTKDHILTIEELNELIVSKPEYKVVGDVKLVNLEESEIDYATNMLELSRIVGNCDDVDVLVPIYLKDAIC